MLAKDAGVVFVFEVRRTLVIGFCSCWRGIGRLCPCKPADRERQAHGAGPLWKAWSYRKNLLKRTPLRHSYPMSICRVCPLFAPGRQTVQRTGSTSENQTEESVRNARPFARHASRDRQWVPPPGVSQGSKCWIRTTHCRHAGERRYPRVLRV